MEVFKSYKKRAEERYKSYGLYPRPIKSQEVESFFKMLIAGENLEENIEFLGEKFVFGELLVKLIKNEVLRGTFPETYKKAEYLYKIISENIKNSFINKEDALITLFNMKGGAATPIMIKLIEEKIESDRVVEELKKVVLVNKEDFDKLAKLSKNSSEIANLIKAWAEKEFSKTWNLKSEYLGVGIKVGDFISTDHLSPGKRANSRTDKPLHATYIMDGRPDEADFMERLNKLKEKSKSIYIVGGEGFGEGSSRKSATYTVLQVIGENIEGEPENKTGGVVIAKTMAPIFRNSLVSSAILPILCNTDGINEEDSIKVDVENSKLIINNEKEIEFEKIEDLDLEKIKAGGVNNYTAGKELQAWASDYCIENNIDFDNSKMPEKLKDSDEKVAMNLAEKLVAYNRIDGKTTVKAGETATVKVRGVYSQDTTGPMTMEEYQSMAGGMTFGADFVVQSLCHTCEAPSSEERDRHKFLVGFVDDRGGVGLRPGEGIIHTIGNRFVTPTDIIVGGDSHTRSPRGISFPGASDIVASCMKYGKMELIMDKVVKVEFYGELQAGMTARDMVSMLVMEAEKQGYGKGVYTGKIIEMYGIEKLTSEEKYILTNAVAERSASAGLIQADENTIKELEKDLEYLKNRPDANISESVKKASKSIEEFLENPIFLRADENAEYDAVIKINLNNYKEPIVAVPHHPDNVAFLSEVAGTEVDEVYIGSCVGGEYESISSAARILDGNKIKRGINFVVSPAAEDITERLADNKDLDKIINAGGVVIMPTCGLCMGNKRRIGSNSTAITTTTRNYQGRLGPANSGAYLGSSLVAACCAILGKFPTLEEYMEFLNK
ncbi:aconitase family protein [Haliovirga abyssi]|uniref:Aconitate hydratase B n=1 Tax=Haliovirga abyssi TaxID=2996794 RepID=A0AAU9DWK5_9FUSO|nr:aconitase family protein [Haliovirga abyssi]BDU50671.1 aconitate hydratase B [Haliovirga abyssi]